MKEKLVPLQTTISLDDSVWLDTTSGLADIPKAHIVREAIKDVREKYELIKKKVLENGEGESK